MNAQRRIMATAAKKSQRGLYGRLSVGVDNAAQSLPDQVGLPKWGLFKDLFFGKIGTMVVLNLLTLIFALPAIAVIFIYTMKGTMVGAFIPYSGNIGLGYPVVTDAIKQGQIVAYMNNMMQFSLLVPCLALLFLGLGGNMFVMRKLVWGETVKAAKEFFRGIKKTWLNSLFTGLFVGATVFLFSFTLDVFDVYDLHVAYKVLGIIFSSLLLALVAAVSAYFMTQSATFDLPAHVMLNNSFVFAVGKNVVALFFVAVAVAPLFLMFATSLAGIVAVFYVMLGFSYASLVLTIYCNGSYERHLFGRFDKSASYGKRDDKKEQSDDKIEDKPTSVKPKKTDGFKNPKKRKKSIDECSNITPLSETFTCDDLVRLEQERAALEKEIADERSDGENIDTAGKDEE